MEETPVVAWGCVDAEVGRTAGGGRWAAQLGVGVTQMYGGSGGLGPTSSQGGCCKCASPSLECC